MSNFVGSFCATDDYSNLGGTVVGNETAVKGVSFSLREFSPCFNDVVVLGVCNIVLFLVCLVRVYQMCSRRFHNHRLRQPARTVHIVHAVLSYLVALIGALQLSGAAGSQTTSTGMKTSSLFPFEVFSYSVFIVTWIVTGVIYTVETCDRYSLHGGGLPRFAQVLVLAGMTIKLYYLIQLKTQSSRSSSEYQFFDVLFLLQYACVAASGLMALCFLPGDDQFIQLEADGTAAAPKEVELLPRLDTTVSADSQPAARIETFDIESTGQSCPEYQVSCCSRLFFCWMTPLMSLGFRRPLENADMWEMRKQDQADAVSARFRKHWDVERARAMETGNSADASLVRALRRTFGCRFFTGALIKVFNDAGQFVGPQVMKALIIHVRSRSSADPQPAWVGYLLAVVMFLAMQIGALAEGQYFQSVMTVGLHVRGVLVSSVFDHALLLSQRGRRGRSAGKMANLISSDAENLQTTCQNMNTVWSAPLRIIVAMVLLYVELSWAALLGFVVLVISVPAQREFVKRQGKLYRATAGHTDTRLRFSNEAVSSMNVIKMYDWQNSMLDRIAEARGKELGTLTRAKILGAWNLVMINGAPIIVTIISFGVYAVSIGDLTAEKAFTAIALFGVLRYPLIQLPSIITQLVNAQVSIGRLKDFLLADAMSADAINRRETSRTDADAGADSGEDAPPSIEIRGGHDFKWDLGVADPCLRNVSLSVRRGELLTIVGRTGSGKSSLLSTMLGEVACVDEAGELIETEDAISIHGSVAYVPQESWIFNATLRRNITFGKPFDAEKYQRAIRAAQMESDLDQLADGDDTEIGEKGVNLSGGQRQRVAIARAVYADADIYLFDDPLSALDAKVARKVYEGCIRGVLRGKTIVLVTNRLEFVHGCDRVLLTHNGTIDGCDTVEAMSQNSQEFARMFEGINEASAGDDGDADAHAHADAEDGSDGQKAEGEAKEAAVETPTAAPSPAQKADEDTGAAGKSKASPGKKDGPSKKGALIKKEHRDKGNVSIAILKAYGRAMGGLCVLGSVVMIYLITEAVKIAGSYWVKFWAADLFTLKSKSSYLPTYVGTYAALSMVAVVLTFGSAYLQTYASLRAARRLHAGMISSLMRAPMSFFHSTPTGRILNRFSKDQNDVDKTMEFALGLLVRGLIQLLGAFIVIGLATPYTLLSFVPVLFAFVYCQRYFQRTSRELKRMDAITRSPVYAHFSECLNGLSSIRAYGRLNLMTAMNRKRLDNHLRMNLASFSANRWLGIRMELLGGVLILSSALFVVIGADQMDPESVGLQLNYAIQITGLLNLVVRISSLAENSFNSVERLLEYTEVEPERPNKIEGKEPPASWPQQGVIEFRDVVARYRKDLQPVLNGLSFDLRASEKVGIVGRTGAGKSSLFLTLFRIIERDSGSITIDGRDIADMGLSDLRQKLAIIPQEPVLFSGSVRFNLDPFSQYSDGELWSALERAHLKEYVQSHGGLAGDVGDGGSSFSVGQRQLLCLARALLRQSKILVLDEATAAVDVETDALIQQTIKNSFAHCTTLTIAHRLNTIIDSDRILVLDKGSRLEYDTPLALLSDPAGVFSSMVAETGPENAALLRAMAAGEVGEQEVVGESKASQGAAEASEDGPRRLGRRDSWSAMPDVAAYLSGSSSVATAAASGPPSKCFAADSALVTIRQLTSLIGSGRPGEAQLRRELRDDGYTSTTWLQHMRTMLQKLGTLVDEQLDTAANEGNDGRADTETDTYAEAVASLR